MSVDRPPDLRWDTSDIYQARIDDLVEEGRAEAEAEEDVSEDPDIYTFAWEFLTDNLTEMMQTFDDNGMWSATVEGFGWRSQSGFKPPFKAETGTELLRAVLPRTRCTFSLWKTEEGFKIENAHHDKPMGGEWYTIKPVPVAEGY